jgi:hypothetical protein
MKKFLPFLSLAVIMAACNSNPENISASHPVVATSQAPSVNPDTAGFAAFQNYKAQNELVVVEEPKQTVQYAVAKPVKKATTPVKKAAKSVASAPKPVTNTNTNSTGSGVYESEGSGTIDTEAAEVAKAPAKEGWSKAAKGAVIGGAGGAIAGAVLNKKNRTVGAVIGAVIGAGGGYVVGRGKDKKDGRIE